MGRACRVCACLGIVQASSSGHAARHVYRTGLFHRSNMNIIQRGLLGGWLCGDRTWFLVGTGAVMSGRGGMWGRAETPCRGGRPAAPGGDASMLLEPYEAPVHLGSSPSLRPVSLPPWTRCVAPTGIWDAAAGVFCL